MAIKILAKSSFFFRKLKRLKPFWRKKKKGKKKVSLRNPRWLVSQHLLVPVCFFMTSLNVSLSHHGWWCYNDHQCVFCCLVILSALTGVPGHFCSVSKKIFGCNFFFHLRRKDVYSRTIPDFYSVVYLLLQGELLHLWWYYLDKGWMGDFSRRNALFES